MGGLRAGSAGLVAAVTLGVVGLAAPSYADDTVVVQGTAFPDPARANLSFVGCGDLYQRSEEPLVPTIGRGPGAAPAGERSLGFDLAGGNAVGALFSVDSVLTTTTASLAVNSVGRAAGVAYAGYQEPADAGTSYLWLGRSELSTPGGAWQTIEATTRNYLWTKYDMTTRLPVLVTDGVARTVADFAHLHGGDGPGVFTIGFGCDGTPFSMDQLRVGSPGSVTTYDVEGLRTKVTVAAQADRSRRAGDSVTLTGQLQTGTGDPVPHATMVLEQRKAGSDKWTPVLVAPVGPHGVRAEVTPEGRTFYRWRFVDRPLAEGSTSVALLIDVLAPLPSESPSPSSSPTDATESPSPSSTPSSSPSSSPTEPPSSGTPSPSESPADPSTPADSGTPSSESTSESSSSTPSPSQTGAGDESASPHESSSPS
jgi:hypothetical protein